MRGGVEAWGWVRGYIFQEAQQVCNSFALAVCQHWVVDAVS
jgi:hypothetical protein